MATTQQKLATSLAALKKLQDEGIQVYKSSDFSRTDKERLLKSGYILQMMRGWYVSSSPTLRAGDTTPLLSTCWEFISRYYTDKYGENWCLSPEQSLLLHAANTTIPLNLVVYSPEGSNNTVSLPMGVTLVDMKSNKIASNEITELDGLRVVSLPAALGYVTEAFYKSNSIDVRTALAAIRDGSELLDFFLVDGKVTRAGRVAGALRAIGNTEAADNIMTTMKTVGHDIRESNPFDEVPLEGATLERVHPIVWRLNAMWEKMRDDVIKTFPEAPERKKAIEQLLKDVEARYEADAYHSLSIEGYKVSTELIDRIAKGNWSPEEGGTDASDKNALAASGYWKCFQKVKETISTLLSNNEINPGEQVEKDHRKWYLALFGPLVTAGVCDPRALAGYRRDRVIISESRHAPPNYEAVPDAMAALFTLLKQEEHPAVRIVLGHWMFGYIHPYMDGNGRMARFLMNVMLIAGGYDWLVIDVANRTEYMAALESASVDGNIVPFADFLGRETSG